MEKSVGQKEKLLLLCDAWCIFLLRFAGIIVNGMKNSQWMIVMGSRIVYSHTIFGHESDLIHAVCERSISIIRSIFLFEIYGLDALSPATFLSTSAQHNIQPTYILNRYFRLHKYLFHSIHIYYYCPNVSK